MILFWMLENWKTTLFLFVMIVAAAFFLGRNTAPSINLDAATKAQIDKWFAEQMRQPGLVHLKPGDSVEWVGLDDRKRSLWINTDGRGIEEIWLNGPDDPMGLKPLTEEEFQKVKDELKKRK